MKRLLSLLVAATSISCAGSSQEVAASPGKQTPSHSTTEGSEAPRQPPADRCVTKEGPDQLAIISEDDGYLQFLPGKDWEVSCDSEHPLFAQSKLGFYVSISVYVPNAPVVVPDYLMKIGNNVANGMRSKGLAPSAPAAGLLSTGVPVVKLAVESGDSRSYQLWTTKRRPDGAMLDLHVSWTGPKDWAADGEATILAVTEKLLGGLYVKGDQLPP